MYKRKAQKIRLVNSSVLDGATPRGMLDWKTRIVEQHTTLLYEKERKGRYNNYLILKFSSVKRGSRLTAKRIIKMIIREHIQPEERELLLELLYKREAALS